MRLQYDSQVMSSGRDQSPSPEDHPATSNLVGSKIDVEDVTPEKVDTVVKQKNNNKNKITFPGLN